MTPYIVIYPTYRTSSQVTAEGVLLTFEVRYFPFISAVPLDLRIRPSLQVCLYAEQVLSSTKWSPGIRRGWQLWEVGVDNHLGMQLGLPCLGQCEEWGSGRVGGP